MKSLLLKIFAIIACLATGIFSFSSYAAEDFRVPENRVIYEVFVRNFSPEGTFKGVEKQIPRLKELGVDVIWLMPIQKLGEKGKWGTYSSPYAVRDYKAVNPSYGTEADFRSLVNTIHANGMEVWLDWVANHTSLDNVWVTQHPEYYGNKFTNPHGWNDVYQLDFSKTALHDAMIDAMQYWVSNFDVDGFRCDYASGPTNAFWQKATSRVLKNGQRVAWLAEDDSKPELVANGWFDYNYAWSFHDRLRDYARGMNVADLKNKCADLHRDVNYVGRSRMVYLSNHDVVQDCGGTEDVLFHKYLFPYTVLQFTNYGMPLLYNGQEIQYHSGQVLLSEKTPIDWSKPNTEMTNLIKILCTLKHTQPALQTGKNNGVLTNLNSSDNNVYAYERRLGDESVVVVLNFGDRESTFNISGNFRHMNAIDVMSGKKVALTSGVNLTLPACGYAVFIQDEDNVEVLPEPERYNIYIKDQTGWNALYIYAYFNDGDSIFGNWPGRLISETEIINGEVYKVVSNLSQNNNEQHFILHNGTGTQYDVEGTFPIRKDIWLSALPNRAVVTDIPTGIEEIDFDDNRDDDISDDSEPIFFTLQGERVANAEHPGIYICVKNGKSTKILVK